ncbi:protein translocase subunit SecF, partial [Chloroflexota bacterium]
MFDFVGKKHWFLIASAIIILAGVISMVIPGGLKLGIDFKAGISANLVSDDPENPISLEDVKGVLDNRSDLDYSVQELAGGEFFIRAGELSSEEQSALESDLGGLGGTIDKFKSVSAAIASETIRNAAIAVGAAAIAILLYITWAFRKMPSPFRYGVCTIIALAHDVLIVLGIFSFLGRTLNWEIDPMFVVACLAVIGYSVNDTIVVFDRLRENLPKGTAGDFGSTVNLSITGTLSRSLNSSITTLLAVLAVYLFVGGE